MFGQVQEATLERVKQTFEGIKEAFVEAKGDTYLPTSKLIGKSTPYFGMIILRSLVADKMLDAKVDRSFTTNSGGRPLVYKPTHGGWELLSNIHKIPVMDLYKHYMDIDRAKKGALPHKTTAAGKRPGSSKPKQGICVVCHDGIMSRRVDATVCWGCEAPKERMKRGMDHVPRTQAYLKLLRPTAAQREQARVDAIIAKHRQGVRKDNREAANGAQDKQVPLPKDAQHESIIPVSIQLEDTRRRLASIESLLRTLMQRVPIGSCIEPPKLSKKQMAIAAAREALAQALAAVDE